MTAEKNNSGDTMDSVRFISLVSMFAASAYQNMGKLADPQTGKVERNLEAAQGFIDVLIMLRRKTKGNLSAEEERLFASTIGDLQMNFVQEKAKPPPEIKPEEKAKTEEGGPKEESKGNAGGAAKSGK
ncbi:MAG: DUF1844 domain-containing protein [Candidatus Aureabacteria bacterium]|nr:DUF1844 domain-containing protein [Candidatus Auribacterota bacterium]